MVLVGYARNTVRKSKRCLLLFQILFLASVLHGMVLVQVTAYELQIPVVYLPTQVLKAQYSVNASIEAVPVQFYLF